MHLSAGKEFQALSGMKDTLKRKVLEPKGTSHIREVCSWAAGGGDVGFSKEHRDVPPHHVNTNHVERGCSWLAKTRRERPRAMASFVQPTLAWGEWDARRGRRKRKARSDLTCTPAE